MCIPLKSQTLSGNKIDYLRGFETVSYLLEGEFTHEDFLGHHGVLKVDHLNKTIYDFKDKLSTLNIFIKTDYMQFD